MSKYIKLEDAISKIVNTPTRVITDDLTALADRQHEIIDMLVDLPTIEVSEDAISREHLLSKVYDMDNDNLVVDLKDIEDAPSVVPTARENRTTEQSSKVGVWLLDGRCSNCLQAPHTTHKTYCPNCGWRMKG